MKRIRNIVLLIFIGVYACKKSPEYFIGKWQILNVVEDDKSTNLVENWMYLKKNGTFDSYDGTLKKTKVVNGLIIWKKKKY